MNATQSDENSTDDEEIVIEQCSPTRTRKQAETMSAILEYGRVTDDSSLNIDTALEHTDSQRGYAEETFGKYGRVARYATDVDKPSIEVVREPSGRGGEVQKAVLQLIDEYATLDDDGTVDIGAIASEDGPNGETFDSKVIARNVGRAAQVNLPWEDRPDNTRETTEEPTITDTYSETTGVGGTFDDPVLNQLFSANDVPSDPIAAFRRGWDLRDRLEQNGGKA